MAFAPVHAMVKPVKFSLGLETTVKQLRQDEQAAIQANLKQVGIDVKTDRHPGWNLLRRLHAKVRTCRLASSTWPFTPPASIPIPIRADAFSCVGRPEQGQSEWSEQLSLLRSDRPDGLVDCCRARLR